ncbi:MAG TPA: iron ABC transporter permease [Planctomycetota bacterium]|nr:iron ABC transporter permease [Planctomycetota bacterium]
MRQHLEKYLPAAVAVALLAFFTVALLYPLTFALKEAVWTDGALTFRHITRLFQFDAPQWRWMLNSLALAAGTTLACALVAYPLAWFQARTTFSRQNLLGSLLLLPLIIPPFVGAIGLRRILAKYGTVNLILMKIGFVDPSSPIDFLDNHRLLGCIAVMVLHFYPLLYLNLAASIGSVDPALLESSKNLGMTPWRTFRKIVFPLSLPGLVAGGSLVFIGAFMDLGTPLIFGFQNTVARQIYSLANEQHTNPAAPALVSVVTTLVLVLFALTQWAAKSAGGGGGVKGQSRAAPALLSPRMNALAVALHVVVIAFAFVPHISVILSAFSERWMMTALPETYSLQNMREALGHSLTVTGMRNSLVYSGFSTAADVVIGLACAWAIVRGRGWFSRAVDLLSIAPLAIPGLVLAFGYIGAFDEKMRLYGAGLFLILSYTIRRLPYTVRACAAGLQQTPVQLEEAAGNLGENPLRVLKKITFPLISANVAAGAILAFSFAMLEVSDSIVLAAKPQDFPLTKSIWILFGNPGNGDQLASALGVVALLFLTFALLAAGSFVGRKWGEIFKSS